MFTSAPTLKSEKVRSFEYTEMNCGSHIQQFRDFLQDKVPYIQLSL